MEITHKLIPSAEENRKTLTPGEQYVVVYWDCHMEDQRATGAKAIQLPAIRNNPETLKDFDFCDQDFIHKNSRPLFEKKKNRHHIVGWYQINQWRMKDE